MLGMRLVRLIERHSEALSPEWTEQIRSSERTSDFRRIPSKELQLAAAKVDRNSANGYCKRQRAMSRVVLGPLPHDGHGRESACITLCGH
jgi:hypothetical protein